MKNPLGLMKGERDHVGMISPDLTHGSEHFTDFYSQAESVKFTYAFI